MALTVKHTFVSAVADDATAAAAGEVLPQAHWNASHTLTGSVAFSEVTGSVTGPIGVSGAVSTITSQTGTGTKFVVDSSPTIATPTFTTNATVPLVIGGSGTTGTQLTLKTTTGNGTTDALTIVGGNNGATTFATFNATQLNLPTGQIKFPATQVPSSDANTLDDYEEGTFTPSVTFATPGDLAVSFSLQFGSYTKIGRCVVFTLVAASSSFTYTTASGFFEITGFPFTIQAQFIGSAHTILNGYTKAGFHSLQLETSNSTFMYVNAGGSGVTATELTATDVPTGGSLRIYSAGFYNT